MKPSNRGDAISWRAANPSTKSFSTIRGNSTNCTPNRCTPPPACWVSWKSKACCSTRPRRYCSIPPRSACAANSPAPAVFMCRCMQWCVSKKWKNSAATKLQRWPTRAKTSWRFRRRSWRRRGNHERRHDLASSEVGAHDVELDFPIIRLGRRHLVGHVDVVIALVGINLHVTRFLTARREVGPHFVQHILGQRLGRGEESRAEPAHGKHGLAQRLDRHSVLLRRAHSPGWRARKASPAAIPDGYRDWSCCAARTMEGAINAAPA